MENKINLHCLILLLLGVISIASCKKDANIENHDEKKLTNAVNVENGYLKFRDQKALDSIGNLLLKESPDELNKWEQQFNGFESYRKIYSKAQEAYNLVNDQNSFDKFIKDYSKYVSLNIDSSLTYRFGTPFSSCFINANGDVKVGNEYRKYSDNTIMVYNGKHLDNTQILLATNVKRYEIKKSITVNSPNRKLASVKTTSVVPPSGNSVFNSGLMYQEVYYNSARDRRLHVDLWYEYTPPPSIIMVTGTSRFYFVVEQKLKKTFGGWRANNTNYHQHSFNWQWETTAPVPQNVHNFNGGYRENLNTTGPIYYSTDSFSAGECIRYKGTARFVTGGVPDAPVFSVN